VAEPILSVDSVTKEFDGLVALDAVSFGVAEQEILAIIGPNGAGKTTMMNLITGVFPPTAGRIELRGVPIGGWPPHRIAALGIARTFQSIQVFGHMSVVENVMVGRHLRGRAELVAAALRLPWATREEESLREGALERLELVGLADKAEEDAGSLPLGQQRLLELARALAAEPALLLLDEPAAGLNTRETEGLAARIGDLRHSLDLALVLVDHDMSLVMDISDRIVVLDHGSKIAEGSPRAVQNNPAVIAAYLGQETYGAGEEGAP
jgi:branched-chain amino acid transport system ATP-binding protein